VNPKTKGIVIGTGGLFTGMFASQGVSWDTGPKALLAAATCCLVSIMLFVILPKAKSHQET